MTKTRITTIISILVVVFSSSIVFCKGPVFHPDLYLSLEQRIVKVGYPIEVYQVKTEDDYLISLYRIPHGIQEPENHNKNKSIVLILHGMGGCPTNFIILGKNRAAAYYFADMGMDVWLFAARGSVGSFKKRHTKFDWDKDPEYWSYSMHEIGKYDLPATIDFILNHTGQKKVTLIGHSAGGHESFVLLSEKPEYNEKVKLLLNWGSAPVIKYLDYPALGFLIEAVDVLKALYKFIGSVEAVPYFSSIKQTLRLICADPQWEQICHISSWIIGSHKSYLHKPAADIQLLINDIARISTKIGFHFMDNIKNGTFRHYDYGSRKNMKLYGQAHPPHYNLSAVVVPVAFFVGLNDGQIGLEDVYESVKYVPNTVLVHTIDFPKFTHIDFIYGLNSTELLYEPTLKLINDYDNGILPPPVKIPNDDNK